MTIENKRDLSISMLRANLVVIVVVFPVAMLQFGLFLILHGPNEMGITWNFLLFLALVVAGILVHELIHGLTWVAFGKLPFSAVQFGFQWKSLTPYAHLKAPVEVTVYRLGGFMPGFVLGIVPYCLSLALGDGNLLWFGMIHTLAASGDWLILWLLRSIKRGTRVEDHPTRAGCYVIEG
jgi:hypothetical protein